MTNILIYNICKRYLPSVRNNSTVQIPKRVKRNNLTVLRELASTLKTDYGGTQYQFIDDPYLVPISAVDKKVSLLSMQSGRNAARYAMQQHPKLFTHDTSFPTIKDFLPPLTIPPSEGLLNQLSHLISLLKPLEAYAAYKKALDEGIIIPRELLDDLLDLWCFTNGQPLATALSPEIRHYMDSLEMDVSEEEMGENLGWRAEGPAEDIFRSLQDPSCRNISAIIKGRIKFQAYDLAFEEYTRLIKSKTKLGVGTHNSILSATRQLKQQADEAWDLVLGVFTYMSETGVKPDLQTFNEALSSLYFGHNLEFIPNENIVKHFNRAINVMAELLTCGLKPSLTTCFHLIEISYPTYSTRGHVLNNIIQYVCTTELGIQHPSDYEFFKSAMQKCHENVRSVDLANSLHRHVKDNSFEFMLGGSKNSSNYFTSYFCTLLKYGDIGNIIEQYYSIVPNMYVPTYKVMKLLLKAIEQHYAYDHIHKLWKDMVAFRFHRRNDLVTPFLGIISKAPKDEKLESEYVAIVDELLKLYEQDVSSPSLNKSLELSGVVVSECMLIYINAQLFHKASNIYARFFEVGQTGSGLLREEPLGLMCQHFQQNDDFEKTHEVLKVMAEYGYCSVEVLVQEACTNMHIGDHQKIQLRNVLMQ